MTKKYDVAMIGLGPVGTVSGACFAKQGFQVIGVDIDEERVKAFNDKKAPFTEPGVNELVSEIIDNGTFRATTDFDHAVTNSRIVMIAVGTPTPESGSPNLSFLDNVAKSLGEAFKGMEETGTIVVLRSTVPPGTMRNRLAPVIAKESGLEAGKDFYIASNPEFLREGMAIKDFFNTGRVVIGAEEEFSANAIEELYKDVVGERIKTTVETGEFAKYVDNTWHALKVAFGNEIGRTVTAFGGNVDDTIRIFLADKQLNISSHYLRPGFAFGGSCLPKDVRGLNWFSGLHGASLPIVASIMASNEEQIDQGVKAIIATGAKKVGLLGVAFKEHVDDLREAPSLYIVPKLRAAGIEVFGHDVCYDAGEQLDTYRDGGKLEIKSLEDTVEQADVLVLLHNIPLYRDLQFNKPMVDLTKNVQEISSSPVREQSAA